MINFSYPNFVNMAKQVQCRLYSNTGFDSKNIPSGRDVLELFTPEVMTGVWVSSTVDMVSLRLTDTNPQSKFGSVDYVCLVDGTFISYYTVGAMSFPQDSMIELTLLLDPWLTSGGYEEMQIINGWAERLNPIDDELYANTLPEPWSPSREVKITKPEKLWTIEYDDNSTHVIASTVPLDEIDTSTIEYGAPTSRVVLPDIPSVTKDDTTTISMREETMTPPGARKGVYRLPNTQLYEVPTSNPLTNLNVVRSLGVENCITASYILPNGVVNYTNKSSISDRINELGGLYSNGYQYASPNYAMKYPYTYVPKNKKAYQLFNDFTVFNIANASKMTYPSEALFESEAITYPKFERRVDPSPKGSAYLFPSTYYGGQTCELQNAVQSARWLTAPITYDGSSGDTIYGIQRDLTLNHQQNMLGMDMASNRVNSTNNNIQGMLNIGRNIGGIVADPTTAIGNGLGIVGGLVNTVTQGINSQIQYQSMQQQLMQNDRMANFNTELRDVKAPDVTFPTDPQTQNLFGNSFYITRTYLHEEDIKKADQFLTAYGYAVDEPLVKARFKSHVYFNYVKASEITTKFPNVPRYIVEQVNQMLTGGIRLWHTIPNQSYILNANNPKRS